MDNVGDEKQVKQKRSIIDLDREKELEEFRNILKTYGGRSFIWRILERCGIYSAGVTDALETFRELGKRDIGLWVLEEIFSASPDIYTTIRNEASERMERING